MSGGRARLAALDHGEFLSPRLLAVDGFRASVALVANRASLLAGDRIVLEVEVGAGGFLEMTEPAGTVAYHARGGSAEWCARVRVRAGGAVVWDGAPFVVAAGAAVRREVTIDLEAGATALIREQLVLGRGGEPDGGLLRSRLSARLAGAPLLVEELDLTDGTARRAPGILGQHRVLSTAVLLGIRPEPAPEGDGTPEQAPYVTRLAGPGGLAQVIADHAHLATDALAPVWRRWLAQVRHAAVPTGDDPALAGGMRPR